MTFNPKPIMDRLLSIGASSGLFQNVAGYEPRGAPANGLTLTLFSGPLTPVLSSGLASASLRWQIDGDIYLPVHKNPPQDIDTTLMGAAGRYMELLCSQFTLGGLVRCIDILGADGERLAAVLGWKTYDQSKDYRVATLMIPLILNDVFEMGA